MQTSKRRGHPACAAFFGDLMDEANPELARQILAVGPYAGPKRRAGLRQPCRMCGSVERDGSRGHAYCSRQCRLLSRVKLEGQCWVFHGEKNNQGYGVVSVGNRKDRVRVMAHRLAFELFIGPIKGVCVLHKCDNPPCCNPAHLFAGSLKDNTQDMLAKGRGAQGAKNIHAKLTDADVMAIRSSTERRKALAERYGISRTYVTQLKRGDRWAHLNNR